MLSHTSGIPNPTIVPPANTLKEGVARLHDWKLNWEPGDKYMYSNPNYWILARLVEVTSGLEFEKGEPIGEWITYDNKGAKYKITQRTKKNCRAIHYKSIELLKKNG